jgi:hypothetical protein
MKKKNPNSPIKEKRGSDMPPDIQIAKWRGKLEVDEKNKLEFKKGPDGKPVLPDESSKSVTFSAMTLYFKALTDEINYQKQIKRIVNDETKENAPPNAIHNDVLKVVTPIKTHYKKGVNQNKARLNPFFQIKVVWSRDNNPNKGTQFLDMRKTFKKDGKQDFEKARLEDGSLIDNNNIHKWITFGIEINGVVSIDSICMSNMGISCQAKATIIVSQPRIKTSITAGDIFSGEGDQDIGNDDEDEAEILPVPGVHVKDDIKKAEADKAKDSIYQANMTLMKKA